MDFTVKPSPEEESLSSYTTNATGNMAPMSCPCELQDNLPNGIETTSSKWHLNNN